MRLTRTQGQKLASMENALADARRQEREALTAAAHNQQEGHRSQATQNRKLADGFRRIRERQEKEIADRKANPGKYRW